MDLVEVWKMFREWLQAPKFDDEPGKNWFAGLLNAFTLLTIVFSFFLFLAHIFSHLMYPGLLLLVALVFMASILALVFIRKKMIYPAAIGLLITGYVIVTLALVFIGTAISAVTSIYGFIIVIASLLFGKRGLIISVAFSSAAVSLLILAERYYFIHTEDALPGFSHWITFTTVFGLVGTITYYTSAKLQQSEFRYRTISDLVSDFSFVYRVNTDGSLVNEWSAGPLKKLSGYTSEELSSRGGWAKIIYQDDIQIPYEQFKVLLGNRAKTVEYRIVHKDGSLVWVRDSRRPVWSEKKNRVIKIEGAIKNISDSKKLMEHLKVEKEKAEEADRLKSSFLANMSHEIRTPLNGMLGFAELLLETDLDYGEREQFIEIIRKSGQNMLHIINDIIDISKVESGLMEVNIAEHHVNETLQYLEEFFQPDVHKRGLRLSLEDVSPDGRDLLRVDQFKLNEILTNLIKNAIKYTPEGDIKFGYHQKKDIFEFYVSDTGRGIPKNKLDSIFDRFIQAGKDKVHIAEGSGLGLSIAKAYVEMHHGKIWVESQEGKGSSFYFTIPKQF